MFIAEATSLAVGDLVVHADHGIGRFDGLQTITALGAPHDCLELHYAGGDKLFCRSRTSSCCRATAPTKATAQLDGSAARPGRRARRGSSSACARSPRELIKIAAAAPAARRRPRWRRRRAPTTNSSRGFRMRRPRTRRPSIEAVLDDSPPAGRWTGWSAATSASARRKSRCALRSSRRMAGFQVAVVVPTTLLARQHFATFTERFAGLAGPHRAGLASRRRPRSSADVKDGLDERHRSISSSARMRCSARTMQFARLGLVIVDEEQHFGVAHKERLK